MAKNEIINVFCFNKEIGRLGFDENSNKSFFQYNSDFLNSTLYSNLFPETGILKRVNQTQVFSTFNTDTFRGLPPMFADSLPDMFGNIIFKKWLQSNQKNFNQISVLEQLAYVSNRGMGALEYKPSREIPSSTTIDINEIVSVLKEVLSNKTNTTENILNSKSLLNVFKIGTSAGGARPKILISENKKTGKIIPGDINFEKDFNHYIIKLSVEDDLGYSREVIEYCYYLTAIAVNINMMQSKLINKEHFATLRFDRQNGLKKHILTATGLTGWDFKNAENSSYENLFDLAVFLKIPHKEIEELYRRMVFNIIFCNTDDHLKNHSFIYNETENNWNLSPAYDLTYSLNPLMNYKRITRALSINNKRVDVNLNDVLAIAENYTIKNAKNIVLEIQESKKKWKENALKLELPLPIIESVFKDFKTLL